MKDVLDFLRNEKERFISGEELSRKLKVSRAAVWKEMQHLRKLGYEIEAQPHLGYRLIGIPDKLFADEIRHGLETRFVGHSVFSYETLDSTNDAVMQLGKEGLKEGAAVFAEHQKKGRGRLGRSWVSPKGKNLLFSVLLRPQFLPGDISKITLTAGLSVAKVARRITGKAVGIKWPNDIVYEEKKIGGILTEMNAEADRVNFVVLGIGLNVNAASRDLVPGSTCLKEVSGSQDIPRVRLAQELLRMLEADYLRLKAGDFDALAREWEDFSAISGRSVTAKLLDREIHGLAVGIDPDGALWIRKDNGIQERVIAGDIRFFQAAKKTTRKKEGFR